MTSPLEYILLMMMTTPDPSAAASVSKIEPASGNPQAQQESFIVRESGDIAMRTILMEPRDMMTERLEAPVKIPPELIPSFKIGTPLKIKIDATGKSYDAKIVRIESITDETGSSVQVITALNKRPAELEPGMVGTAVITETP